MERRSATLGSATLEAWGISVVLPRTIPSASFVMRSTILVNLVLDVFDHRAVVRSR